jgi:ABC-2 type transport system ATP-binding protein
VAYPDLTGEQYLGYLGALRGGVDALEVERLAKRFDLDLTRRIGTLSHGSRQKIGIVQAFMHRPELLVLDEPTSGLDPLMQQEFLTLVGEVNRVGVTVFLSSHILSEVEAIASQVAILRDGVLVTTSSVDELRAQVVRRWDVTFTRQVPLEVLRSCPEVMELTVHDRTAHLVLEGSAENLLRAIAPQGIENIQTHEADLTEVFLRYYTERS